MIEDQLEEFSDQHEEGIFDSDTDTGELDEDVADEEITGLSHFTKAINISYIN